MLNLDRKLFINFKSRLVFLLSIQTYSKLVIDRRSFGFNFVNQYSLLYLEFQFFQSIKSYRF